MNSWLKRMHEETTSIQVTRVAQGYRQGEGVDYDEVFAPVARIEAIRLFLAFASFMGFIVYQMDVKSAFLYGNITEEVYVKQPPGFEDPAHPNKVYVDDIIFGSTKPSMVKDFEDLMQKEFKMSSMGELTFFLGLQVKQSNGGKDEEGEDVDVHLYRSMIGCLMYLTASRPDIMFAVCLCARFQVTPKVSHLHAVKRIFRYLKHHPKLGLWYPKDSPFHLEAFSDSDYAGDNHDRRSTSGGCQYLGRRLVSWQCKKQTIVAISSTEAEYVAAASCCAQVLWMQNQLLDYGFNFMNTEIHIDNESTICIVKNPVFHSKTKHIQIRHHFIRDCYEQRLINVVKGLATNQKFNFSLMILTGMLGHISNGTPFLMYPRITPLTPSMLEYKVLLPFKVLLPSQGTAEIQRTADFQEHNVQEEDTPDLERKSDETEEVNLEEKEASNVKS
ncbi:putative ribonuclease H-like domain-containing protein, partial [Tanacetum coccineum]